jgi:hypothetical protein
MAAQLPELGFDLIDGGGERLGLTNRYCSRKLRADPRPVDDESGFSPATRQIAPLQFIIKDSVFALLSCLLGLIGTTLPVRSERGDIRVNLTTMLLRLIPQVLISDEFSFANVSPFGIVPSGSLRPFRFPQVGVVIF